jgi:hypothetical protein
MYRLIFLLAVLALVPPATADHEVEFDGDGLPVSCYWTNDKPWPQLLYGKINGPLQKGGFATLAAALDPTDPASCGSYKLNNPTRKVFVEQYFNAQIVIRPHADNNIDLSWTAPTKNVDGSDYTDPFGFTVYWDTQTDMQVAANTVGLEGPAVTTYRIEGLSDGVWYVAVDAVDTSGNHSDFSDLASATITGSPSPPPPPTGQIQLSWSTPIDDNIRRLVIHSEPSRTELWELVGQASSGQDFEILLDEPAESCMFVRIEHNGVPPVDSGDQCWDTNNRELVFVWD